MSNLGYIQMSLKDPLLSVSLFCHLASIILCALILSETLALYKSFTYLLTYNHVRQYYIILAISAMIYYAKNCTYRMHINLYKKATYRLKLNVHVH